MPSLSIKAKDEMNLPHMVAMALQADGWVLRQTIIWKKPNPMPESVTDRCTKAHEYIFLLTKSARYYYDAEAVKEPAIHAGHTVKASNPDTAKNAAKGQYGATALGFTQHDTPVGDGRNRRSVWTIPTAPFPGAHFAVFPEKLIEPCILAGTSERGCCPECGTPWRRVVEREVNTNGAGRNHIAGGDKTIGQGWEGTPRATIATTTTGWQPGCKCVYDKAIETGQNIHEQGTIPCTVLDPFTGAGTTALVAKNNGCRFVGCELNTEYIDLATHRLRQGVLFS